MTNKIRILRVIEYVGDPVWVEYQIKHSLGDGIKVIPPNDYLYGRSIKAAPHQGGEIRVGMIGNWPEIVGIKNKTAEYWENFAREGQ